VDEGEGETRQRACERGALPFLWRLDHAPGMMIGSINCVEPSPNISRIPYCERV